MTNKRAGFIAIIGAPNAGKSTLLNMLVGTKIAIVTHKVQTTRRRILGIVIEDQSQLIFVDTPGIFKPRRRLDRAMVSAAWKGSGDADRTILVIDAKAGITRDVEIILEGLKASGRKAILALNKIDLMKKEWLLKSVEELQSVLEFEEIFMISALSGDGVTDLKTYLASSVEVGPWLYPEDQLTDLAERILASEITREQIFLKLHQEVPYATSVECQSFKRQKDGSIRIEENILVERSSQKGIVIGKGGQTLKKIGAVAREQMEQVFGCKVHLFLFVKVSEKWADNPDHYREIGLDFVE